MSSRLANLALKLVAWDSPGSAAWRVIKGTQDDVGRSLATILDDGGVRRIDDFGEVCKTFLREGDEYRQAPPPIIGKTAVFSFTPKKRIAAEGFDLVRVSSAAGYRFLVLTVQKHGKFGKVWLLRGILRHLKAETLTYYEDTDSVVDELKGSVESGNRTFPEHRQFSVLEEVKRAVNER